MSEPSITIRQRDAILDLEGYFHSDAEGAVNELYAALYELPLTTTRLRKEFGLALTKKISPLRAPIRRLEELPYHPVFVCDSDGRYLYVNAAGRSLFTDLELISPGDLSELYNNGIIFRNDRPRTPTTAQEVGLQARMVRKRPDINRAKPALVNPPFEFVFFASKSHKRLVVPVTGCLYVTTIHNKANPVLPMGTLGMMSVPLVLRKPRHDGYNGTVFVAMPFDEDWSRDVFDAIKKAVLCSGYEPIRIDYEETDDIGALIRVEIRKANIFIGDITKGNPNVMFEVGYADSLGKRMILLNQRVEKCPFNLKHSSQKQYSLDRLDDLSKLVLELLHNSTRNDAPGRIA